MPILRPWKTLSAREQEQVAHILSELKEFNYGCARMDAIVGTIERASAMYRFYMNALYSYLGKFFLVSGHNLASAMRSLGLEDLLGPIEKTLETPLGSTTLRFILRTFRDKMLAHPQFSFDPVAKQVYDKFDPRIGTNQEQFEIALNEVLQLTRGLYLQVVERFPGVFDPD